MINTYKNGSAALLLAAGVIFSGCTKPKTDDDFPKGDPPPIGAYTNSSEIASADLVAYFPFNGNVNDEKNGVTGGTLRGNGSFTTGLKGQAYQGGSTAFIGYTNSGPIATLSSFTTSFWINTAKHDGGAQGIFALPRQDGSFWSNFFVILEGNNSSSNRMQLKLHFEKHVTPSVPNSEHWIDPPSGVRPDNMYGAWRQVTYTYNAATSQVGFYANGQPIDLGADAIRKSGVGNELLGALSFKDASKFVIGGFQNHLGAPFNGLEPWMLSYTGKLDEMRFYKRALTSQEVLALYQLERQGR